ncbi:MAG: hypothetical protein AUJ12_06350 [Alphaproteobacteria bacterium CG1_02_46_17]|nr:MAG: hypothetical protein AUJ12_06350 [Alphaproteobacteria bacterium CG1_02_46_17]
MYTTVFALIFITIFFQSLMGVASSIIKWVVLVALGLLIFKLILELNSKKRMTKEIEKYVQKNGDYFISLIERNKVFDEKKLRGALSFKFYEEVDSYIEEHLKFLMIEYCSSLRKTRGMLFKILNKELQKTTPFGMQAVDGDLNHIGQDIISNYYCGK